MSDPADIEPDASDPHAAGAPATRIAIATCAELAGLDPEGRLLVAECAEHGLAAEPVVWDDLEADWDAYELVVIRSTWDYQYKAVQFLRWAEFVAERLVNPEPIVRWNVSKRYLADLREWGFPVVPTEFFIPGEPVTLPDEGEFVVKPAVSAGSRDTARYSQAETERASAHASEILEGGREVMIQPYLNSVDSDAETAVIVLGGEPSHAMRKGPLLQLGQELETEFFRAENMSVREAAPDELALASEVIARVTEELGAPAYARVDLLRDGDGAPCILELELIEPSLFLDFHPAAATRLAELLAARVS